MINVSTAFRNELFNDRRNYLEFADITLVDGTELNLTNKDLWNGGMTIEDAVSADNSFDIGSAIINKCTIVIENLDDRFSNYDFNRAEVIVSVGLALPDGTEEKIHKGVFAVDEAKYNGSIITLSCLDNMRKFDKVYSESNLPYPATLNQIIRDACDMCDVTLQTYQFTHDDFLIETRPSDEATTFREVVSWCAQIAGCFARCDTQGRLELKWYNQELLEKVGLDGGIFDKASPDRYTTGDDADGGSFKPWDEGDSYDGGTFHDMEGYHHIYSNYTAPVTSTDDVVITGVRVLEKALDDENMEAVVTYLSGSDGYVVEISNNDLIQDGNGLKIADWLGEQLNGFRFRKAQLSHASDPTIEAGDVGFMTDRKQNSYPIIISSTKFSTGGAQVTNSSANDPIRNSATRFSAQTKNYVESRRMVERERTEREKVQEELGQRIDNSSGLYTTKETQKDGSKIFYLHDKPILEESMIVWKMTKEAWGVSTDGGKTYNGGMTVDGDAIARILTAVGIKAEWINTGRFTVSDSEGNVTFLVDCDTGNVEIVADKFSLSSGKTIDSIADEKASGALESAKGYTDTSVSDFISETYNPKIAELQKQLDGQIESFYYDYAPELNKPPSDAWTSDTLKARHEGDLFFDKTTGLAYRFFEDNSGWTWQLIKDNDISKAIADAAHAQYTADGKRRTFLVQPTPPYDEGDLWYGGTDKDVLVCKKSRESGNYDASDWGKYDRYIDQATASKAASDVVAGISQTDVLNKLTNGGIDKGIYLQDGHLYISFNAARGGELTLGGADNGKGKEVILDDSGEEIGRWDNKGIQIDKGTIRSAQIIGGSIAIVDSTEEIDVFAANSNGFALGPGDGVINYLVERGSVAISGELELWGTVINYANNNFKSLAIGNNQIDFYAWNDNGNYVGSIGSIRKNDTGRVAIDMYCDMGDMLELAYKDTPGSTTVYPAIQVDSLALTQGNPPWIANTASGKIFGKNGDGITVQNGLITEWNYTSVTGDILFYSGSGAQIVIHVADGLITGWEVN